VHRHWWSQPPPPFEPQIESWVCDRMQVPGPVGESVAVLGRVLTAIDEFLDAIAWPS
jgi:hypothetical protein